jgi:aldose 1-epimerase
MLFGLLINITNIFMEKLRNHIERRHFGFYNNKEISVFRLTNIHGGYVEVLNYGAIVKSIVVPDRDGALANVILGYPTLEGYLADVAYIGATIGRFSNRISNASFSIGNEHYQLDKNDGVNNNHSGYNGFNKKVFDFVLEGNKVIFTLTSPDGEGGFPGNLNVKVSYEWTDENKLVIDYFAETDKPTPTNFTNHAYFNLSGSEGTIHDHKLLIKAGYMLESTADYIPTGNVNTVGEHGFRNQSLGQVMKGSGLNNFYIFDDVESTDLPLCELFDEDSGRLMQINTSYPGVQLYTGDFLNTEENGYKGKPYKPYDGLCLECQFYPDSPNHANFPDTILRPGEVYNHSIVYAFGTI